MYYLALIRKGKSIPAICFLIRYDRGLNILEYVIIDTLNGVVAGVRYAVIKGLSVRGQCPLLY